MRMRAKRVVGIGDGEEDLRLFAEFHQDWTAILFGDCAWYDFTLIDISGEYAPFKGSWEVSFALLGFHLSFTYVYDNGFNKELKQRVHDFAEQIRTTLGENNADSELHNDGQSREDGGRDSGEARKSRGSGGPD